MTTIADHRCRPRDAVDIPATAFAAAQGVRQVATRTDDPPLGGAAWVRGPITRITLPGDHLGPSGDDNVDRAAAALDGIVQRSGPVPLR